MRVPVAREGVRYIFFCAALGGAVLYFWPVYAVIPFAAAVYLIFFFRDPRRNTQHDNSAIVAPADGRVVRIDEVMEDSYLRSRAMRVSIFMSIFNVHINYCPVSGTIDHIHYRRGSFKNAMNDISSLVNENNTVGIRLGERTMAVRQIAGIIARRIVCRCSVGDRMRAGEKFGLIKFGSRVDLFLPMDSRILVSKGDRVRGGETMIAMLGAHYSDRFPE